MPRPRKPARLYQRNDDGAWIVIDCGKQIRTGFGDGFRREAECFLADYIGRKMLKRVEAVEIDQITIGEVLTRYGEEKINSVKDGERLVNTLKALAPYWANKRVSEVNSAECKGYIVFRNRSAWTVRREMTSLNAALKMAVATRRILYAPSVTLPPKGAIKDRWLDNDEIHRLMEASAPHVQRFIRIALASGRRKTSITNLKWHRSDDHGWVDLENKKIHFLGAAEEETKKRRGVIQMPQTLWDKISQWEKDSEFVISHNGSGMKRIDKAFRRAVERAGLKDCTPHTLKHTAVTRAFMAGMTLELARDYFATSREVLERVYRSYSPLAHKEAAAIMDKIL